MEIGKWFNYGKVELRFETIGGEDRKIWLYIKEWREFVDKFNIAQKAVTLK